MSAHLLWPNLELVLALSRLDDDLLHSTTHASVLLTLFFSIGATVPSRYHGNYRTNHRSLPRPVLTRV